MKKNTVAFLTRSLVDATGNNMWRGIVDGCKKEKTPIITFRGPVLYQGNGSIIYQLFNDDSFGGIISWASSDVSKKVSDYYLQFNKTPVVCVTFKIPGKSVIFADCRAGMIELMNHLINVHKFRKIAFIRGPEAHVYAKERYEAYLEALQINGIEVDEKLISPNGNWGIGDGEKAIKYFIQNGLIPGKDFQAVVCVGDNVAIGAQECLINQGYQVPYDVSVCGFNGTNDAAWCNPPITTVEMPFNGIGQKSLMTLLDDINGASNKTEFRYSTSLLLGESCGCKSRSVQKAIRKVTIQSNDNKNSLLDFFRKRLHKNSDEIKLSLSNPDWIKQTRKLIISHIESSRNISMNTLSFFKASVEPLLTAYTESVISNSIENSEFISMFSKTLNKFVDISNDIYLWQDFLSVMNQESSPIIEATVFASISENLLQQARILINEFDSRHQKQLSLWNSRYEADLRSTSADLLSSYDISTLMDILQKSIKKLNIPGVYVVLYEDCKYTPQNNQIPKKSKLILAIRDNERLNINKSGFVFDTEKIIPDQFLPQSSFYSLILESLHFQDTFIGYIVFQEGPKEGGPYVAIRDQISSSIYGAIILENLNKHKNSVENTMLSMSEKADVVADNSKNIAENINSISVSMESVTENIKTISDDIQTVSETLNDARDMISEADTAIENLVASTGKISNAITMINDIAETTNVLALNASIEASHAGDAGQGFSVVAKEVKVLAAKTVESTEMIFELVTKNTKSTQATQKVIESTNRSIKRIAELAENIKHSINGQVSSTSAVSSQIANASSGTEEISKAIDEIAHLGDEFKNS